MPAHLGEKQAIGTTGITNQSNLSGFLVRAKDALPGFVTVNPIVPNAAVLCIRHVVYVRAKAKELRSHEQST